MALALLPFSPRAPTSNHESVQQAVWQAGVRHAEHQRARLHNRHNSSVDHCAADSAAQSGGSANCLRKRFTGLESAAQRAAAHLERPHAQAPVVPAAHQQPVGRVHRQANHRAVVGIRSRRGPARSHDTEFMLGYT